MPTNPVSGYYDQPWEARLRSQVREECAQLVTARLDEIVYAAQLSRSALREAVQQLAADLRAGVLVGSARERQSLSGALPWTP